MFRFAFKYVWKNKQTRLILFLTLGISLSITFIGLLSYAKYREVFDTGLNTPNVELLQINLDVTNRAFRESDNKAVDISFNADTQAFISADTKRGKNEAPRVQEYLKTLAAEPDIHSIAVIKFRDHTVISSDYGYKASFENTPDAPWSVWIRELERKPLLVKRRMYDVPASGERYELLSLARPIVMNGKVQGAVLVNLDYDRLFSKLYTHVSDCQYVFDLEEEMIYPKLNMPFSTTEMDKVIKSLDVRPYGYVKIEGEDYIANQAFSDVTGWRFVSLAPMDQLLKNAKLVRNTLLLLSFISILVGCSAMYYSNYAAFRPLKRINRLLYPNQKQVKPGSLYELEPVIDKLVGDFRSKSAVAEWSLPELRSKFLQDILSRSIGSREISTKWQHYYQDWDAGLLLIVVLSIDCYGNWAARYKEEDRMLLKYALNNIVHETLESSWRTVSLPMEKDSLVILMQAKDKRSSVGLTGIVNHTVKTIHKYLQLSVSAGIGPEAYEITDLSTTCEQANKALSYRLYTGYGQVHSFADIPGNEGNTITEAASADERLISEILRLLHLGNRETGIHIVNEWINAVRQRKESPDRVYLTVDELLEKLLQLSVSGDLELPPELADYTRHQIATVDLDEIENLLKRIITHICDQLGKRRTTRDYQLVQSIINYMKEHLHEAIGLQDIADEVHKGVSSISTIFKDETGSSIYDYLTGLRIHKACELLTHTGMKISEVALSVGYQNENSFIRAFRKHQAMTPGKYREANKFASGYADSPKASQSGNYVDGTKD